MGITMGVGMGMGMGMGMMGVSIEGMRIVEDTIINIMEGIRKRAMTMGIRDSA
jgi:hypothetical protein